MSYFAGPKFELNFKAGLRHCWKQAQVIALLLINLAFGSGWGDGLPLDNTKNQTPLSLLPKI
jgi:hypothetical protein